MADRGRDLKVSILSDADRFDLAHPADELDTLADASKSAGTALTGLADDTDTTGTRLGALGDDARRSGDDLVAAGDDARRAGADLVSLGDDGRRAGADLDTTAGSATNTGTALDAMGTDAAGTATKLETLGKDTKSAGDDLDTLAKDAKTVATKVDSAFDKIAKASKTSLGKGVDDGATKAKSSLKDVGDEATGTARETAASFDGTASSVADSFQEIAANALAALGPVGAGIGLAAAFGMGILRAQAEKTKETISGLVTSIIDQGGKLDRSNVLDKLAEFAADGTLVDLKSQAEQAKIPVNDFLLAMAGDPDAIARSTAAIGDAMAVVEAGRPTVQAVSGEWLAANDAVTKVAGALTPVTANYAAAADAAGIYASATGTADAASAAFTETVAGFSDTLGAYTDTLADKESAEQKSAEATAAATKDQSDSWQDYADDVDVSVRDYLRALTRQVRAQEDWEANMTRLAGKVSDDTLTELARMGPEGAPLVAKLATASDKELKKLDALLRRRAGSGVDAFAAGIADGATDVGSAAAKARKAATDVFHRPIKATLELDTAQFYIDLGLSTQAAKNASERYRP